MSISFFLRDRSGKKTILKAFKNQSIREVLITNSVPPPTVVVRVGNKLIHESNIVRENMEYVANLIEGYDINFLRDLYKFKLEIPSNILYSTEFFSISRDGYIKKREQQFSNLSEVCSLIEEIVYDTIQTYSLISKNDKVLVGLSGGVDSSSLITILSEIRKKHFYFDIIAATFEDYESEYSYSFQNAKDISKKLEVKHKVIKAEIIEKIFNLNEPLKKILNNLMSSEYSHQVMYIDHHTTRRALEVFAERNGIKKIILGLHKTDILGGWINSIITDYKMDTLPLRTIESFNYIFPLIFISKKQLHIYYLEKFGEFIKQSQPNPWEFHPKDRNFFYFLADFLQYYWPGIEHWVLNKYLEKQLLGIKYERCLNCGAYILLQDEVPKEIELCDVCNILSKSGYIDIRQ